jgi:transcriptional regulator with XRE-family HTH domain
MAAKGAADNIAFGAASRAERLERGYSVEVFAGRSGFEPGEVEAIERGERRLTYLTVLKIAKGLGVRPSKLVIRAGL